MPTKRRVAHIRQLTDAFCDVCEMYDKAVEYRVANVNTTKAADLKPGGPRY